jgi:hypothetical protein
MDDADDDWDDAAARDRQEGVNQVARSLAGLIVSEAEKVSLAKELVSRVLPALEDDVVLARNSENRKSVTEKLQKAKKALAVLCQTMNDIHVHMLICEYVTRKSLNESDGILLHTGLAISCRCSSVLIGTTQADERDPARRWVGDLEHFVNESVVRFRRKHDDTD